MPDARLTPPRNAARSRLLGIALAALAGGALAFLLVAPAAFLPAKWRNAVVAWLTPHDRKIGAFMMLWAFCVLGWGIWRMAMILSGSPEYAWWGHEGAMPPFVLFPDQ